MNRVGALLWIGAALGYFLAETFAAAGVPGYSYLTDYISVLGDPNRSPRAAVFNAALVGQAVLFPAGAFLLARNSLPSLVLTGLNGVGNLLVATVHSGSGSVWHPIGAALAIGCGNAAVLVGAGVPSLTATPSHRVVSLVVGLLGLLCLIPVALAMSPVGLWERASAYPIFGWQAYTACWLLFRRAKAR
jgi:hypothetical membrane protein